MTERLIYLVAVDFSIQLSFFKCVRDFFFFFPKCERRFCVVVLNFGEFNELGFETTVFGLGSASSNTGECNVQVLYCLIVSAISALRQHCTRHRDRT